MDAEDWSAIGTAAGAIVALGAMTATIWQARMAKTAANAAGQQVELIRQQLEVELAERDHRDAPSFELTVRPADLGECITHKDGSVTFVPLVKNNDVDPARWAQHRMVELRMTAGPTKVLAEVVLDHPYGGNVRILDAGPYQIVKDSTRRFTMIYAHRLRDQRIEVVIHSTESPAGLRTWISRQEIAL
jgi:hypothetical protein